MQAADFSNFLNSDRDTRRSTVMKFINSNRNLTLEVHRDYYNGKHWDLEDTESTTNKTRSGKLIWGKKTSSDKVTDPDKTVRAKKWNGSGIAFHAGQLQKRNYCKTIPQKYSEQIAGDADDKITIKYVPDNENQEQSPNTSNPTVDIINAFLDDFWSDVKDLTKSEVIRMTIDTVSCVALKYQPPLLVGEEGTYYVEPVDSEEIFPIYKGKTKIGTMRAYSITVGEAREFGIVIDANLKDSDSVSYAVVYIKNNDVTLMYRIIDGELKTMSTENGVVSSMTNLGGKDSNGNYITPEINYDPYEIVANIDHPFRQFDESNLEDSEIFELIDLNDSLNGTLTILHLTNMYIAMPKLTIDVEAATALNINIDSDEFEESLDSFQYFGGAIDNFPVKVIPGQTVPDSFYKGLDGQINAILTVAGIPSFMINGEGMSNVTSETIGLGLKLFIAKIEQKRERIRTLIRRVTIKVLIAKKLIDPKEQKEIYEDIEVNFPFIATLSTFDFLTLLINPMNPLPQEYKIEQFLRSTGRYDDFERVKAMIQNDLDALREQIEANSNANSDDEEEPDNDPPDSKDAKSDLTSQTPNVTNHVTV